MDRTLTLARRANGWTSSAQVAAMATAHDHEQQCDNCGKPGASVLTDDGWQGTVQSCPESDRLRHIEEEQRRADRARATEADPRPLTPEDQALLAAEAYDWLAARPRVHDQSACIGPVDVEDMRIPRGEEPPTGTTLCIAAAVCHLAGYELRADPVARAYRMSVPIPHLAAWLLALTEDQPHALLNSLDNAAAMARLATLARRQ
ncbi:hypothetical protein SLUN_00030 [Streptomyces lunaelactis]|uniref:Uncharacterized protein n=1 Tax=Streptomyces lunaelactis TaxID=1535768 RepID=A0A2R4SVL9_9ACTN|nr:hypothetical protein [Streptomyces lunaelactis]AVZ70892.1 hypothetical protein SLUN_00030 [Streptomyces lunaelactis]NUK26903.1 hypothetical protein [Streptomyces lunaelactis]NUK89766.1 hypothetical protein [Streptomyces lunaelactis]